MENNPDVGKLRIQVQDKETFLLLVINLAKDGYDFVINNASGNCLYVNFFNKKIWISHWTTDNPIIDINDYDFIWLYTLLSSKYIHYGGSMFPYDIFTKEVIKIKSMKFVEMESLIVKSLKGHPYLTPGSIYHDIFMARYMRLKSTGGESE